MSLDSPGGGRASTPVLGFLYSSRQRVFMEKLREQTDPRIIYVTDLVACSHKRVLRMLYPLLAFRFEPSLVLGDLVHAGLESILSRESGGDQCQRWVPEVEVEREFRIGGEVYKLKGRADLVLYDCDKPVLVAEIKTARALHNNKPLEHHLLQLQVYMELLDVDRGVLVYVTPDRLAEYSVERARVNLEALVREAVEDAKRPRYDWECSYCPFDRLCPHARVKKSDKG